MKNTLKLSSLSCAIVLAATLSGFADETSASANGEASMHLKNSVPARVNRAKSLIGMQIRNERDQRLGKVKDVVLDLESSRIAYVVLSTGGLRPKYLALPPSAFTASSGEKCLVLNADRDKIKHAAGFSKNNWPNMATPSWGAEPFWQTPDGKSYEYRNNYDKNREFERKSTFEPKGQDSPPINPEPTPTPPDE